MDTYDKTIKLINTIWAPVFYAFVIAGSTLMGLFAFMAVFFFFWVFGAEPPKNSPFIIIHVVAILFAIKIGRDIEKSKGEITKIIGNPENIDEQ